MKYWSIFLSIIIIAFAILLCITPSKKIKCVDDMCVILEKTLIVPKPRISQYFFKSDIKDVVLESSNGKDVLVLKRKSGDDIYLKFIHNTKTIFKSKDELNKRTKLFFRKLLTSKENYESQWQRDVGSIQIYMYGKPLFD